jgi:hypothetical protein
MTSSAAERRFTFLEYLELEKRSEQHHEFVDGYVYAMSGARRITVDWRPT